LQKFGSNFSALFSTNLQLESIKIQISSHCTLTRNFVVVKVWAAKNPCLQLMYDFTIWFSERIDVFRSRCQLAFLKFKAKIKIPRKQISVLHSTALQISHDTYYLNAYFYATSQDPKLKSTNVAAFSERKITMFVFLVPKN